MGITIIVAATVANGIGHRSRLPWRLPQEMAYFARLTSNAPAGSMNAVIMGRKTWESIPGKFRPLRGRINEIITRDENFNSNPDNKPIVQTYLQGSLQSAISHARTPAATIPSVHRCFIVGGASIYNEAMSSSFLVDRILLTRVLSPAFEDCDIFFPEFREQKDTEGKAIWERASNEELQVWAGFDVPDGVQEENGVHYEFQMWTRKPSDGSD
ncbi:hypothetical protein BD410DRAFT_781171 [Rickenella mellea]|uniref:Dihydrofolate reductase n=1 Tax=Rickenella mellea TaxID=50990 RepID=A0A4Y7QNK0_9AGAM|nr:hypothetical protein BD410DRAFT_781171 [Rickenella mellea]